MPSPSQDSEKLTDARAATIARSIWSTVCDPNTGSTTEQQIAAIIATELSSTAALAREEAAQYLQAITKSLRAEAVKLPAGPGRDIVLARADSYKTGAAAIRAIGKEG